ncbi:hypothetical protein ACKKBG_A25265 [Auxenochlorella protothecoides x Auxenochlorella symbiontica]
MPPFAISFRPSLGAGLCRGHDSGVVRPCPRAGSVRVQGAKAAPTTTGRQPRKKHGDFPVEETRRVDSVGLVQWYPGHIAAAERSLQAKLAAVDLVVEVRDGRCPVASAHPALAGWCRGKRTLLLLNRVDMVGREERAAWSRHLREAGTPATWTDGRRGGGVREVEEAAARLGAALNARREARGLRPRAVRAAVVGFPNVGKSALINRLLGRRAADSAPRPGVTRQLTWARAGEQGNIDLLDTPGIIPVSLKDKAAAARLAMCNDIGEAAYTASRIAASFLDQVSVLPREAEIWAAIEARYRVRRGGITSEEYVERIAQRLFNAEVERAGQRILRDFRDLKFGEICLEVPSGSG